MSAESKHFLEGDESSRRMADERSYVECREGRIVESKDCNRLSDEGFLQTAFEWYSSSVSGCLLTPLRR